MGPARGKHSAVSQDNVVPSRSVLRELLTSWEVHLRAERKSPATVKSYGDGVRQFIAWCAASDRDAVLDRLSVNAWVAELLEAGAEPATARSRQLAVRRFSSWLAEED